MDGLLLLCWGIEVRAIASCRTSCLIGRVGIRDTPGCRFLAMGAAVTLIPAVALVGFFMAFMPRLDGLDRTKAKSTILLTLFGVSPLRSIKLLI